MGKLMNNNDSVAFYKTIAEKENLSPVDTKLANKDSSVFDSEFIMRYADKDSSILDLASGTGLIINRYYDKVKKITAVELFEEFTKFIIKAPNVQVFNMNLVNSSNNSTAVIFFTLS
ncbi:hypothetical protein AGMMS49942_29460 [Spirochaetia bacterium]|nr:hypothetical protein AGMMS49942_29460 [Spirochaetia bacterium]